MTNVEWLLFLPQLPATPSSLRVAVWRKLRAAGALSLQQGVWVLPRLEGSEAFLTRLLAYIKDEEANAQILRVQGMTQTTHEEIIEQFQADRAEEYHEFLEQSGLLLAEIEKETQGGKFTFAELEENEQNLRRLRSWLAKIQKRDFFKSEIADDARAALMQCQEALSAFSQKVYSREGIEIPSDHFVEFLDAAELDEEAKDGTE